MTQTPRLRIHNSIFITSKQNQFQWNTMEILIPWQRLKGETVTLFNFPKAK